LIVKLYGSNADLRRLVSYNNPKCAKGRRSTSRLQIKR